MLAAKNQPGKGHNGCHHQEDDRQHYSEIVQIDSPDHIWCPQDYDRLTVGVLVGDAYHIIPAILIPDMLGSPDFPQPVVGYMNGDGIAIFIDQPVLFVKNQNILIENKIPVGTVKYFKIIRYLSAAL